MDLLAILKEILALGWPAIVLVEVWLLWRRNEDLVRELIALMRECMGIDPENPKAGE